MLRFVADSNVCNSYLSLLQVMIGTACRCGEIIGLTWSDVDMKKMKISINHRITYRNYGDGCKFYVQSTTKTDAGNRVIPMAFYVWKALLEQKKQQFMPGIDRDVEIEGLKGFIFTGKYGKPMMPSAVNSGLKKKFSFFIKI